MSDSEQVAALIERIRTLERQAHALQAPFAGGDVKLAADNALTALSMLEAAVRDAPEDDVLTGLEETVDDIAKRLAEFGRLR
jgi:hypothetical protein